MNHCPCGKPKPFVQCCGRFINGSETPKTPEQLMRSRYSAYALGGYGEYLLQTWFPPMAQGLTIAQLSEKKLNWQKLDVLDRSQQGDDGVVEFKAWFQSDSTDNGGLEALHEISEFKRIGGRWLYVGGRVE